MINELDEETKEELSESFGRMNQAFDKMDEQFKEMTNIIDKSLETAHDLEDVKVMIVKGSWKNAVIERILYFLLGGVIGLIIHYCF